LGGCSGPLSTSVYSGSKFFMQLVLAMVEQVSDLV
jgi:hypothetical protein